LNGRALGATEIQDCFDADVFDATNCEDDDEDGEWTCDFNGDETVEKGCSVINEIVTPCGAAYTTSTNNSETCDRCEPGFGGDGTDHCVACAIGTYNALETALGTLCTDMTCLVGTGAADSTGHVSETCVPCDPGDNDYSDDDESGQCQTFAAHEVCGSTDNGGCSSAVCDAGYEYGNPHMCEECPSGKYKATADDSTCQPHMPCDTGYIVETPGTSTTDTTCSIVICTPTQVANSDKSDAGSIAGNVGDSVFVTCDGGYSGGGAWTCGVDEQFSGTGCTSDDICSAENFVLHGCCSGASHEACNCYDSC